MQTVDTNIVQLHAFEVTAMLHGAGLCRIKYENGNLIIPIGSAQDAFAFIHRLAPPKGAAAPAPEDHIDRTVSNLRKLADQLDGTEAPEVREVVDGAVALAASKLHERNGHTNGVGTVHAPLPPDLPVDSVRTPPVNAAPLTDEPKTGVRVKTERKPREKKADPDAKPRNVTDDVADQAKVAPADLPEETADAPKEPAPTATTEEETQATGSSGLDEAYISGATKMRDIVVHMYEGGLKSTDAILAACEDRKSHPVIGKAAMSADRVERMLMAVGIELPGAGA